MKAVVASFNLEKALVGAFPMIVHYNFTDQSFTALQIMNIRGPHYNMLLVSRLGQTNIAVYGVELLVRQVMDESLAVASTALG